MCKYNNYSDDPFFKCTDEEMRNMTHEEFCALIEEHNEYARKQFRQLSEQEMPRFNTVEDLRAYYNCMPLDEAINKMNQLFDTDD